MRKEVYSKVLVATDGSECARKALESAIKIVKASNGSLTIIHVLQIPRTVGFGKKLTPEILLFYRRDAKAFLAEQQREVELHGIKADILLREGSPAKAILNAAKAMNADLIVMGSRGLGGVKELFLGSVSNAVVHSSKISVLITK
ncbi:universal stress protein UspA-like protein [Candidatus Nitrososphaera evergladensis SR1]|uniref:Universal stress protein UspA-like protein n=1 Tax=Candidatus Nitrososphaera evergladensis SR1 TaxID=1459636 RepID=A0A075MUH8_9ARCH|nr:universal stress protein [Candidatus Nitrososphaera evergladensis]AIF82969.1 universal stress protein UspA-like protein [Candidatus Nitrososphaera evergladensis SR1]